MPELPEVEVLRRELGRVLVGKTIARVETESPKMIRPLTLATLNPRLARQKITAIERSAKVLLLELAGGDTIAIHLKLTGQLIFIPPTGRVVMGGHPEDPTKYTRLTLHLADGSRLLFNDLRKFGWLRLVTPVERAALVAPHGLDPLTRHFTLAAFTALLARYPRRIIKHILLDQSLAAGIGNIYADEACFLAGVLPTRVASSLTPSEIKKLHAAISDVLRRSIAKKSTSAAKNFLQVYGREGEPCCVCETPIKKIRAAGRGTHFCPQCQE